MTTTPPIPALSFALEDLFVHQDRDWVIETIAPVMAWVPARPKKTKNTKTTLQRNAQPFRFEIEHVTAAATRKVHLDLYWDAGKLEKLDPGVKDRAHRFREGRTAAREHITELAAYGLTLVAISVLMSGRRVVDMRFGLPPDILFDVTPGAVRGIEVAGRSSGGRAALLTIRNGTLKTKRTAAKQGKRTQLLARSDIAEVDLSLWCASPRISIMERVKP